MSESCWLPYPTRFVCSLILLSCLATQARAQDEAVVEALAGILASYDAERYAGPLFRAAARHPDPLVRRHAALAMGRIGNPAAAPILLRLTSDPDSTVQRDAVFALGQLGTSSALERLRTLVLSTPTEEQWVAQEEGAAAVAKIGGPEAAEILTELLNRWVGIAPTQPVPGVVRRALVEAWRLGPLAPVTAIAQLAEAASGETRWRAVYTLGRLQSPAVSNVLLRAADDPDPLVRAFGVGALTAQYARTAGLDPGGLAARLRRVVNDPVPLVRIRALAALGTFGGSAHVAVVADRASDTDANVRVQALASLGMMEGEAVVEAIASRLDGGVFATRRQALLSIARAGGEAAVPHIRPWTGSRDWAERSAAATALQYVPHAAAWTDLRRLLADPDERVVTAALASALTGDRPCADSLARAYALHADPAVRSVAVRRLAWNPDTLNVSILSDAYAASLRDRTSQVRVAIVEALGRITLLSRTAAALVENRFLVRYPTADDYLVRRAAARSFPAAAERWGPAEPLMTGRGIEDYRDLARELVLPASRGEYRAELVVETDRGNVILELFAADAPLTAQAFVRLVDRRYFDGLIWYDVQPGRLVASGDRRGDGWGHEIAPVRDEMGPRPFDSGALGLVLDGPDTGSSRFFITLRPEPAFEGTRTAFGRVVAGLDVLERITQGDRIRRVRRR